MLNSENRTVQINFDRKYLGQLIHLRSDWPLGGFLGTWYEVDLAVPFVLADGTRGVIRAKGDRGSLDDYPFIQINRDDRSGLILGEQAELPYGRSYRSIRQLGVIVDLKRGARSLGRVRNASTTLTVPGNDPIVIPHTGEAYKTGICLVAWMEFSTKKCIIHIIQRPVKRDLYQAVQIWQQIVSTKSALSRRF